MKGTVSKPIVTILLLLILTYTILTPSITVAGVPQSDNIVETGYIILRVSQIPGLEGCRVDSLRALTYLPDGRILHGRVFLVPRSWIESNSTLAGRIFIPFLGDGRLKSDDTIVVQVFRVRGIGWKNISDSFRELPWPVEYVKERTKSRAIVLIEPGSPMVIPGHGIKALDDPIIVGLYWGLDPRGSNPVFDTDIIEAVKPYLSTSWQNTKVKILTQETKRGFIIDLRNSSIKGIVDNTTSEAVKDPSLIVIEEGGGPLHLYQFVYPVVSYENSTYLTSSISFNNIYLGPYVYNIKLNLRFNASSQDQVLEVKYVLKEIDPSTESVLRVLDTGDIFYQAPTSPTLVSIYPSNIDSLSNLSVDIQLTAWTFYGAGLKLGGNISLLLITVYTEKTYPETPIPQTRMAIQVLSTGVQSSILPSNTSRYFNDTGAYFYVPGSITLSSTLINGLYQDYASGNGSIKIGIVLDKVYPDGTSVPFSGWIAIYVNGFIYYNRTFNSYQKGSIYVANQYFEIPLNSIISYFEQASGELITITVYAKDAYGSSAYIRAYVDAWIEEWYAPEVFNPANQLVWFISSSPPIAYVSEAIVSDLRIVESPRTIFVACVSANKLAASYYQYIAFELKASGVQATPTLAGLIGQLKLRLKIPLSFPLGFPSIYDKSDASSPSIPEQYIELAAFTHKTISFILNAYRIAAYIANVSTGLGFLVISTALFIFGTIIDIIKGLSTRSILNTSSDSQYLYIEGSWSSGFSTAHWAVIRVVLNMPSRPTPGEYTIYVSGEVNGHSIGEMPVKVIIKQEPLPGYVEPCGVGCAWF
ncbi:hypothetical protein ACSU1N_01855 [Thermogladius sp. 4427co]|uniref:hypothetical protein n=1 Tax=Thermogladius sp. 4427co TaxID=3450718 RepID=UPI003F799713